MDTYEVIESCTKCSTETETLATESHTTGDWLCDACDQRLNLEDYTEAETADSTKIVTKATLPAAEVIEVAIAAGLEIGEDNYGQIIIHTNLREVNTPNGLAYVEIEAEVEA